MSCWGVLEVASIQIFLIHKSQAICLELQGFLYFYLSDRFQYLIKLKCCGAWVTLLVFIHRIGPAGKFLPQVRGARTQAKFCTRCAAVLGQNYESIREDRYCNTLCGSVLGRKG